jgi:hypothetical protein
VTADPVMTARDRYYREIRSARFPLGFPDRSDETVMDAFDGSWLLLEHSASGTELAGLAQDYDAARAWLLQQPGQSPDDSSDG